MSLAELDIVKCCLINQYFGDKKTRAIIVNYEFLSKAKKAIDCTLTLKKYLQINYL